MGHSIYLTIFYVGKDYIFYHDVGEISDLSQSETLNLVMWRVRVMQPTTPPPWRRGRSWLQFNVQEMSLENKLQDKTKKNQLWRELVFCW